MNCYAVFVLTSVHYAWWMCDLQMITMNAVNVTIPQQMLTRKHVRQLSSDEKLKSYTKILSRCLMVSVKIFILGYSSVSSS